MTNGEFVVDYLTTNTVMYTTSADGYVISVTTWYFTFVDEANQDFLSLMLVNI